MNKTEKLKQATQTFNSLYIDNAPKQETETIKIIGKSKDNNLKLLGVRIDKELIDKINHYAYVERLTVQEVATQAFTEYFNQKDRKASLDLYDKLKK